MPLADIDITPSMRVYGSIWIELWGYDDNATPMIDNSTNNFFCESVLYFAVKNLTLTFVPAASSNTKFARKIPTVFQDKMMPGICVFLDTVS